MATDIQCYFALFLLCLFSTLLLSFIFKKPTHSRLPPSPPAYPVIGHLHLLSGASFSQSLQHISSKYGTVLYLRFGFFKCVLISSASVAHEMFRSHDLILCGRPTSPLFEDNLFGKAGFSTAPYGDYWKFMKKLCITELLGGRQILRSRGARQEECNKFLHKMLEKASRNEIVQLHAELFLLTNRVLCRMMFGASHSAEDGAVEMCADLIKGYLELIEKINVAQVMGPFKIVLSWMYKEEIMSLTKRFDTFMDSILKEHEDRAKREGSSDRDDQDLVDILLKVHHDEIAEVKMTMTQIKAFVLDLFVAGVSAVADAVQWALAELINHPNVFKKVREEIESVVGQSRLVEESDLPSLHYLEAVLKETSRLHAPLPLIPRLCLENFTIGEFDVPKETVILINAQAMMKDPNFWDNPNEFYPERFLDSLKGKDNIDHRQAKGQNFSYLPFGMGKRMCPGSALGQTQVSAILASMIQCFDWQVGCDEEGSRVGAKVNMEVGAGITESMAHPLQCLPKIHYNPFAA